MVNTKKNICNQNKKKYMIIAESYFRMYGHFISSTMILLYYRFFNHNNHIRTSKYSIILCAVAVITYVASRMRDRIRSRTLISTKDRDILWRIRITLCNVMIYCNPFIIVWCSFTLPSGSFCYFSSLFLSSFFFFLFFISLAADIKNTVIIMKSCNIVLDPKSNRLNKLILIDEVTVQFIYEYSRIYVDVRSNTQVSKMNIVDYRFGLLFLEHNYLIR